MMQTLPPEALGGIVLGAGLSVAMMLLGMCKGALEQRGDRRCVICGLPLGGARRHCRCNR
jgi:hypothetical protein